MRNVIKATKQGLSKFAFEQFGVNVANEFT